jgi:hypothetical protein
MSGWWVVVDPRTSAECDASEDRMGPQQEWLALTIL